MHKHSQFAIDAKKEIVLVARAMIAGTISFIEGSIRLNALGHSIEMERDDDFTVFNLIASETDALPMGKVRELWNPEALAKLQIRIDAAERWARGIATEHCNNLIERFG